MMIFDFMILFVSDFTPKGLISFRRFFSSRGAKVWREKSFDVSQRKCAAKNAFVHHWDNKSHPFTPNYALDWSGTFCRHFETGTHGGGSYGCGWGGGEWTRGIGSRDRR
jgi:hypothetical protein